MKFDGALYNPDYSGEGIFLTEESDGTVIGGFFSYNSDGSQLWLIASGKRDGNGALLDAFITEGGRMGAPYSLGNVVEKPWGKIEIEDQGAKLRLTFWPNDKPSWNYEVQPIHNVPPAEEPPVGTVITLRQHPIPGIWNDANPDAYDAALWGSEERNPDQVGGMWYEAIFTVVSGKLTIDRIGKGGPFNPRVEGVKAGQVFTAGQSIHMKFYWTRPTVMPTSGVTHSTIEVWAKERKLVQLTAKVMHR